MEFRLGAFSDLPALKAVYAKIVESMDEAGICIWEDPAVAVYVSWLRL